MMYFELAIKLRSDAWAAKTVDNGTEVVVGWRQTERDLMQSMVAQEDVTPTWH